MNTETNSTEAVATQPKTLAEKITEAQVLEKELWAVTEETKKALKPFEEAYNEACREWSAANRRLEMLTEMQKETTV